MAFLRILQASAFLLVLVLALIPGVYAHADEEASETFTNPLTYIAIAGIITLIVISIVVAAKNRLHDRAKKILFLCFALSVAAATLYLAAYTVYENVASVTQGPVHWHADYEVWICDKRLELIDPRFPSNKIGSPLLHEHNDDRIHIEGVIDELHHVNLGSYFAAIGGGLASDELAFPSTKGRIGVKNTDACNNNPATLKVYVNGKKSDDPVNYVPYPHPYVPPGDCIIILFDESNATTTEKICASWQTKGAGYATYQRPQKTIGEKTWQ